MPGKWEDRMTEKQFVEFFERFTKYDPKIKTHFIEDGFHRDGSVRYWPQILSRDETHRGLTVKEGCGVKNTGLPAVLGYTHKGLPEPWLILGGDQSYSAVIHSDRVVIHSCTQVTCISQYVIEVSLDLFMNMVDPSVCQEMILV